MPGKSAMDERHPLRLGAGSGLTTMAAGKHLSECDLIMALGSSLTRTFYGQPIRSNNKVLIQNTDNPHDINKDESVDIGLLGDTKLTIRALIDETKDQTGDKCIGNIEKTKLEIAEIKKAWLEEWSPLLTSDEEPLNTYRVIREIVQTLDLENSIVTHDAGAPRDSIVPFYTATRPHSYVGWGKTTHPGFGIPLMIGAKMASPDKFCLNLMGDGAFGMSGTDLETASRSRFAITTVLLNNGNIATYPDGFPVFRKYGVGKMQGDYTKIAGGMGAVGITVKKTSELAPALEEAKRINAEGQIVLIDVHSSSLWSRARLPFYRLKDRSQTTSNCVAASWDNVMFCQRSKASSDLICFISCSHLARLMNPPNGGNHRPDTLCATNIVNFLQVDDSTASS